MKLLDQKVAERNSLLCLGVDPSSSSDLTTEDYVTIINSAAPHCVAVKFNLGAWLATSLDAAWCLQELVDESKRLGLFVILDGKFGDIGHTNEGYATFAYDHIGVDAVTVNPYMGSSAYLPFLQKDKSVFILARTSAALGTLCIQDLNTDYYHGCGVDEFVSRTIEDLSQDTPEIGAVIGSSVDRPANMRLYRNGMKTAWILCPGVGFQGADLMNIVQGGIRADGSGILVNVGRGILQAYDPKEEAKNFNARINELRARAISL